MDRDVEKDAARRRDDRGHEGSTGVFDSRRPTEATGQDAEAPSQPGQRSDSEKTVEGGTTPPRGPEQKESLEVGWDGGDNDALCPRSFNTARKWLITIIVSSCGFCV